MQRLDELLKSIIENDNEACDLSLLPARRDLAGLNSHSRLVSFQSLVDANFKIPYPWSRAAHYDTEAYLSVERREMGLIKRQIVHHRSLYKRFLQQQQEGISTDSHPSNMNTKFIPSVVHYLYEVLAKLLELSPRNPSSVFKSNDPKVIREAMCIDLQLISRQCIQGTFDSSQYFGHFFNIMENELLMQPDRSEKLKTAKSKIYESLDRFEFPLTV